MGKHHESNLTVVTAPVAAKIKGVSLTSIYLALREGRLRGEKLGGTWLIRREDLDAWEPVGHRPKKER